MVTLFAIALGLALGTMLAIALLDLVHRFHIDDASGKFFKLLNEHS
jgi:hypothetical protein